MEPKDKKIFSISAEFTPLELVVIIIIIAGLFFLAGYGFGSA